MSSKIGQVQLVNGRTNPGVKAAGKPTSKKLKNTALCDKHTDNRKNDVATCTEERCTEQDKQKSPSQKVRKELYGQ